MHEPSANRILVHALWALSLAMIGQANAAESLPASVRACTAEVDRERRLDCFDREVARFPVSKATAQAAGSQPVASPTTTPAGSAPAVASVASATSTAPAGQTSPKAPAANASSAATPEASAARKATNADKPGRIAAQLVGIDRAPNEMVLHLDNGQVWEEVQSVAGDLSLKVGDPVTIDKRLGSYWLTGPHVSGMKVRQRS